MDYRRLITIEPDKRGGKRDSPDLTDEDIRACLAFAADRKRRLVSVLRE